TRRVASLTSAIAHRLARKMAPMRRRHALGALVVLTLAASTSVTMRGSQAAPSADVQSSMDAYNRALGVDCAFCHDPADWKKTDKPAFQTAVGMHNMVTALSGGLLKDRGGLTCWTCHKGQSKPSRFPSTELQPLLDKWPSDLASASSNLKLTMTVYARS